MGYASTILKGKRVCTNLGKKGGILCKRFFGEVLEIFYPSSCVFCGRGQILICGECFSKIRVSKTGVCHFCGKISTGYKTCASCRQKRKSKLNALISAVNFEDEMIKELIYKFKYEGMRDLAPIMAEMMYQSFLSSKTKGEFVCVPVPLFKKRENTRGFNQAELLAREFSKIAGFSGGLALKRVKNTKSQTKMRMLEREKNMEGAFVCVDREFIEKKNVILIDDVITTGATMNECTKVLREAGAKTVIGVSVAKG